MAKQEIKRFNSILDPLKSPGSDFSNGTREDFHLERDENNGIKVVSDGITDYKKLVQSKLKDAGLQNILKMEAMRYGTLDNAIAANDQRKVYADVSNIPESVAEKAEFVAKTNSEISKLCSELGLTKEQLLKLTPEKYIEIKNAQAAAAAAANEGGNE